MRLLVAVPSFNEEATIAEVLARIPERLPGVSAVHKLVVDDGSTDETRALALAAGATVLSHGHNRGVGAALQTALAYAVENRFDIAVNIDADGQFDPEDIVRLIAPIVAGEADFASASRFVDPTRYPQMPVVKFWGNRCMSALVSGLAGRKFYDVSCGFRAYSREALLHLNLHGRFTYTQETFLDLAAKGLRIQEVPVRVRYFADRRSRVANNLVQYGLKTSSILFRFYRDYHPLRFFWTLAALLALSGTVFAAFLLVHVWRTGQFSPHIWAGFVGAFLFGVGLLFFVLGILADMLDRVRMNQERILYLLKKAEQPPAAADTPSSRATG